MADEAESRPQFSILGINSRRISISERDGLTEVPAPIQPGEAVQIKMGVQVEIQTQPEDGVAAVTMHVHLEPDPARQPYIIDVSLSAQFKASRRVSDDELKRFCATNGIPIAWPYVREIVSRATADGLFGAVRLNPINLTGLIRTALEAPRVPEPPAPAPARQAKRAGTLGKETSKPRPKPKAGR